MRLLVGLGHHADLADDALVVDLAGRAVGPRPFVHRPAGDALLVGIGHLVILAVVVEGLLGPRLLDDLERLLVDLAVVVIDRGAVHRRACHVVLLAQHVDPAILIAAGEAGIDAALGQMVEHRQLLGGAHRIPRGQHQPERRELDALGARGEVGIEQQGRHRRLVALGMEMMLGGGHHVEAGIVGEHRELADLVEHLLVALVVTSDRTQALPVLERAGNGGQDEKHELHGFLLINPFAVVLAATFDGRWGGVPAGDAAQVARHRIAASARGATSAKIRQACCRQSLGVEPDSGVRAAQGRCTRCR